jgi:aromatic ring hydroxylase
MTSVRQPAKRAPKRDAARSATKKAAKSLGSSSVAQVRLRADEMAVLREVMSALQLESTSDALREGLRLLAREAAEVTAAEEIRAFYGGGPAPLPDGAPAPTHKELLAADNTQW